MNLSQLCNMSTGHSGVLRESEEWTRTLIFFCYATLRYAWPSSTLYDEESGWALPRQPMRPSITSKYIESCCVR
jgi:hypothetical protein